MKKLHEKQKRKLTIISSMILGLIAIAILFFGNQFAVAGLSVAIVGPVLLDLTSIGTLGNTGNQTYTFTMSAMKGFIIVPKSWEANTAYIASMITNLQADTVKAAGSRIYPVFRIGEITDKSTEDAVIKLGLGEETNGARGKYSYIYQLLGGNHDLQVELAKFAGTGFNILMVDDNNVIYGTASATAGSMAGGAFNLSVLKPKWMTSQTDDTKFLVGITLSNTADWFENLRVVKLNTSVENNVKGILNVTLSDTGAQSTTHIFVDAKTDQGLINLYDTYATELAANPTAWIITSAAGVVSNPSAVSGVAGTKSFDLTGTFATGTNITIQLASPSVLRGFLIGVIPGNGFESEVLTIAIP